MGNIIARRAYTFLQRQSPNGEFMFFVFFSIDIKLLTEY